MGRGPVRQVVVVALVVGQLGCQSVYRFRCTSNPKGAIVSVEGQVQGRTDCTVEIPKDSDLIQDGKVGFTFHLPDRREETKVVDLVALKPSNDFPLLISSPFFVAGLILMVPWMMEADEDEDEEEDEEAEKIANQAGLLGLGALGIGGVIFFLLGGDTEAGKPAGVHVDFDEPADANVPVSDGNQPAAAVPAETKD
jgi:hypothetical protein